MASASQSTGTTDLWDRTPTVTKLQKLNSPRVIDITHQACSSATILQSGPQLNV
ncbi:unnamed protein product, partial [Sphenostylis stenocarpa]